MLLETYLITAISFLFFSDRMSALHHAALLGDVKILKLLLDFGAVVDAKDAKGWFDFYY